MNATDDYVRLPQDRAPVLTVVVDTEEEFDWGAGFSRAATSVSALRHVGLVQEIFDSYGVRPTYVVDYAVAAQRRAARPLIEYAATGRATIGAHLHPWNTPPFTEPLNRHNSFAGNLEPEIEAAKINRLTETIRDTFGVEPRVYKAGRYGLGSRTPEILVEQGFLVDASVCPTFDFSLEGGPDFADQASHPSWLEAGGRRLLELPLTAAFVGFSHRLGRQLYPGAQRGLAGTLRIPGILSRLHALDRLVLSPEGFTAKEHVALTRALLRRGVRTFSWTFHSPSLKPGCTPYVRTESELARFLDAFRRYFDFFFGVLGGEAMSPLELRRTLEAA